MYNIPLPCFISRLQLHIGLLKIPVGGSTKLVLRSTDLNLKISVFFLFSHTLTAESAPLALSFLGLSAACVGPISNTHPPTRGNMVFGLCRGAWPYKGPCTAGGKLAAEALRVLKKSIQHAGARKARLGRCPLIPVAPGPALAWWERGQRGSGGSICCQAESKLKGRS